MGGDTNTLELYGRYADFNAGARAVAAMAEDKEHVELIALRAKDPAASISGPHTYRIVIGEALPHPIVMHREYQVPRINLKKFLPLAQELRNVVGAENPYAVAIPAIAPEMDRVVFAYYAQSLEQLARVLEIGASENFQSLAEQAAQYGTLLSGRVLTAI